MANTSLYIKGSRTKVLDIFPPKSLGKEGDFIISRIAGKGIYLCTKVSGSWYVANRLEELKKLGKTSISDLTTKTLSIKSLVNSSNNTDKILVSDLTNIKYRTNNELFKDLNIPIEQINYKTAYCSLDQYNNKEDCWANGGTWYYSENDSHDSISNTAENELLTIGSSIGKLDAESTLTYDGSTLEIKRNTDYDDNWQTSVQDTLLKLSYDSTNSVSMKISSGGDFTITPSGGDARLVSTLKIDTIAEIGSDTDKILMSDSGVVKYVTGANLRSYIGAGTSSFGGALNDLSDVTYSSGDLTISSLDKIISGALEFDCSGDITMDAAGGDVNITSAQINIDATKGLYLDGGGNTYIHEEAADKITFTVGGDDVLALSETGTAGNKIFAGNSAIGFFQFEPTYNASDTEVNFAFSGNKASLTFGAGNITDLNLVFPDMSCNCILLITQDGTGSRLITNYKTFDQSDGNESTVKFAGGSNPTLTTTEDKTDIISFYWDNDNHIAYEAITYNF